MATIGVAKLETEERFFEGFEIEVRTSTSTSDDSNLVGRKATRTARFLESVQRWQQVGVVLFPDLTRGTTYWVRSRVLLRDNGPASTWTSFESEVAGDDVAPNPSYSLQAFKAPAGVLWRVTPSGAPSDVARYEAIWKDSSSSTPLETDLPLWKGRLINGLSHLDIETPAASGVVLHLWVRAVDTSGNRQAWYSLGSQTVGTLDNLADGSVHAKTLGNQLHHGLVRFLAQGKNLVGNPSFEKNSLGRTEWEVVPHLQQVFDGWTVWAGEFAQMFARSDIHSSPGLSRTGVKNLALGTVRNTSLAIGETYGVRVLSDLLEVVSGDVLHYGGFVRLDSTDGGAHVPANVNGWARIGILFYDKDYIVISEQLVDTPVNQFGVGYVFYSGVGTVPVGTVYAHLQLCVFIHNNSGSVQNIGDHDWIHARFDDVYCVTQVETNDLENTAVTAAKRGTGAVTQDLPENRLWNNWFEGTVDTTPNGSGGDGSPPPPDSYLGVGFPKYQRWANFSSAGSPPVYNGAGEVKLYPAGAVDYNGIQQTVPFNFVGLAGEPFVAAVQVKRVGSANGIFYVQCVPVDDALSYDYGNAVTLGINCSEIPTDSWVTIPLVSTLPNTTTLRWYAIQLMWWHGTTGTNMLIRRAQLNRATEVARWTPDVAEYPIMQHITSGTPPGGGGDGDPPGGGNCPPGDYCWL